MVSSEASRGSTLPPAPVLDAAGCDAAAGWASGAARGVAEDDDVDLTGETAAGGAAAAGCATTGAVCFVTGEAISSSSGLGVVVVRRLLVLLVLVGHG